MRGFSELDPIAVTIWFFCVTGIAMFCSYPALMAISLAGGILFYLVRNGRTHARSHLFFALLFIVLAIANPLISHNGVTVLFVINNSPVTLEAALYGLNSAAMIVGVLYWFRSFTQIMTSDKLLHVTGVLSPKLSLVLSMAIRFVPLFNRQSKKTADAQKAMGLFSDDNIIDDIKGRMRVFSIVVTWALENGITTADSMEARGYGVCRRTQQRRFRFTKADWALLITAVILMGICAWTIAGGSLAFSFYPEIKAEHLGTAGMIGIAAYALLALLPVIIEMEVSLKWRSLRSKI